MNQTEEQIRECIALKEIKQESDYMRHVFIEAGAGAGKTTLICNRICNLLRRGIYKPEEMVVITFTNKAAVELYDRIYKKLDEIRKDCIGEEAELVQYARENIDRMCISTIHSFCNRILTEQVFYAGRGMGFALVEEPESAQVKMQFLQEWFVEYSKDATKRELLEALERLQGRTYYKDLIESAFLAVCDRFDEELVIPREYVDIYKQKSIDALEAEAKKIVDDYFAEVESVVQCHYGITLHGLMEDAIGAKFKNAVMEYRRGFTRVSSYLQFLMKEMKPAFSNTVVATNKNDYIDPYISALCGDSKTFAAAKKAAKAAFKYLKDETGAEFKEETENLNREKHAILYVLVMTIVNEAKKAYGISRDMEQGQSVIASDMSKVSNDELLHLTSRLVQSEAVVERFQKQYRCYFVDEFQDTDHVQKEIIWKLTGLDKSEDMVPKVTAFFVGDPKQSIYRFRGAEVKVFNETREELLAHKHADVYTLQYNYRSNEELITEINRAFGKTLPDYVPMEVSGTGKEVRTSSLHGIYQFPQEEYEKAIGMDEVDCLLVAELVYQLLNQESYTIYDREKKCVRRIKAEDILVLMHTQKNIPDYVKALNQKGIAVNASGKMDISMHDVLKRYIDLVGGLAKPRDSYVRAMAVQSFFKIPVYGYTREEYKEYAKQLREVLKPYEAMKPEKVIRELIQKFEWLLSEEGEDFYYVTDARTKLNQMMETVLAGDSGTLLDYYEAMCLYRDREIERELILDTDADAVRVMNIHKAKGLEAPIIIIANRKKALDFSEDSISIAGKRYQTIKEGTGNGAVSVPAYMFNESIRSRAEKEEAEELVRLEYVAATRAEEVLILLPVYKGRSPLLEAERFAVTKKSLLAWAEEVDGANSSEEISRSDLMDKPAEMEENNLIPTLIPVTPSGLESKVKKLRIGDAVAGEGVGEEVAGEGLAEEGFAEDNLAKEELAGGEVAGEGLAEEGFAEDNLAKEELAGEMVAEYLDGEDFEEENPEKLMAERPKGNIFGTVMHRFFELLANDFVKEKPGNRKLSKAKAVLFVQQAVLESSEEILERYPTAGEAVMKHYSDFLKELFKEGTDVARRFENLLQDAEEIYTELPFSYYLSEEEKPMFGEEFSLDIAAPQKVWVNGTTDLVIRKPDGSYKIIDYKSDDLSDMTEEAKQLYLEGAYGKQMKLYKYSVSKIFETAEGNITCEFFHLY